MELKRDQETVILPCAEWVDETGKVWSNPQLAFFLKRGFAVVETPPPVKTLDEQKADALAEIKRRRDSVLRQYSEKLVIYKPNFDAALSISQGTDATFLMPNGSNAHDFATAAGAAMNLTHEQWSGFILGEWQTLGTGVAAMENAYLRHTYHDTEGINALTTAEQVNAALEDFRAMTGG